MEINKQLERARKLGIEWIAASRRAHASRGHTYYCEETIRVYRAENSDHCTVNFGKYPHVLEVTYHSVPQYQGSANTFANLESMLDKVEQQLKDFIEYLDNRGLDEEKAAKASKAAKLREELADLED